MSLPLFLSRLLPRKSRLHAGPGLALLAAALLPLPAAQAGSGSPPTYTFHALGTLGSGTSSVGTGVNDAGQVVGYSYPNGDQTRPQAFLSAPNGGALHALGTLGGSYSYGSGVNSAGQVAGTSVTAQGVSHAFLSAPNGGALHDLGTLGGTSSGAAGVNDSGQVVGDSTDAQGVSHAFLSDPNGGALHDLGGPGVLTAGVNNAGQVVGQHNSGDTLGGTTLFFGFLTGPNGGPGPNSEFLLGGIHSFAAAVNDVGQVTGNSGTNGAFDGDSHAFLTGPNGSGTQDLGDLGGGESFGEGINNAGQVVGFSYTPTAGDAFLFTGGQMLDLNSLVTNSTGGFTLEDADGISNTGFITGQCYDAATGQGEAFLLTPNAGPVPEASTTVSLGLLLALGLGGVVTAKRRKARGGE